MLLRHYTGVTSEVDDELAKKLLEGREWDKAITVKAPVKAPSKAAKASAPKE